MNIKTSFALSVCFICAFALFVFAGVSGRTSSDEPTLSVTGQSFAVMSSNSVHHSSEAAAAPAAHPIGPVVVSDSKHDLSLPLRWTPVIEPGRPQIPLEIENRVLPSKGRGANGRDTVVQSSPFSSNPSVTPNIPSPSVNFEGINNRNGVYPPDTNGAVGPNHYVQIVNLSYAVYSKTGAILLAPRNTNLIWSGFGGPCETRNDGDPIVLHDQLADRWLISQFALPSPYYQCIAISQTADPTGAYYRYAFVWSNTLGNDYPHFGVWPDAYYMSTNEFLNFQSFAGAGAGAFERSQMLLGQSARLVAFHQINDGGQLPSDLDGSTPPPAGAPNYFADWEPNAFHIWKFHVDWNNTGNSTFTNFMQIAVAAFTQACTSGRSCIPQPGTNVGLDGIGDRLMFRLAYRKFSDHESLLANHSVNPGSVKAGVRWYEIRSPGASPTVYQQGTYSPADGLNRWMGSIAMDQTGNIALGYSVSNASVFPSIRYTGRLVGDPLGTLPQGEATIKDGTGSQTGTASRWGDYSAMSIDPSDDCTFYYTTEYIQTTGVAPWQTRVASFKFPSCGGGGGCTAPSGFNNNTATDISACADTGVQITWTNPSSWGDSGGTRTHDVLRDGVAIATGLAAATTSYVDNTGTNGQTYTYTVRHNNGCGSSATTSGANAADNVSAPPVIQTASQSGTLTARNNTVSSPLSPAFTIALGQASSATVTWSLSGPNLTACAVVSLRAPDATSTTLKAAGAANTGSANVLSFYNSKGPGTYTIVLQELTGCGNGNQKDTLSNTTMTVQKPGTCP